MQKNAIGMVMGLGLLVAACSGAQNNPMYNSASTREANLVQLGDSIAQTGDDKAAEETYKQAIALSNGSVEGHKSLADLYLRTHRPEDAERILEDALKIQPNNKDILIGLGNHYINEQEPSKALTYLNRAVEVAPREWRAFNSKGVALDAVGKYEEAQYCYKHALGLHPTDGAYVRNNLALSYLLSDKYEEAIRILTPLASSKTGKAVYRQNLAMAYGLKGDYANAMKLGLRDLPQDQAKENVEFFRYLVATKSGGKPAHHKSAEPRTEQVEFTLQSDDGDKIVTAVTPVSIKPLHDAVQEHKQKPTKKPAAKTVKSKPKPAEDDLYDNEDDAPARSTVFSPPQSADPGPSILQKSSGGIRR